MHTKKFYWIKLKTDFFSRAEIDFILSQEDGFKYIVLYLILCLNTANTNGELKTQFNDLIVPYDIDKIVRDTKYFDFDTVSVALDLYKKLGLVYVSEDDILKIANYEELVGSEVSSAKRVREHRQRKKALQCNNDVTLQCNTDVTQEIRDKSIEYRDIDNKILDINNSVYKCHLKKIKKDSFCFDCQKKNVCANETSSSFVKVYGCSFEDYMNGKEQEKNEIIVDDYDWLNEEKENDIDG